MIPVIGTAVVSNTKWVKRLYNSIDFPVDNFFIINNNGKGEINDELEEMHKAKNPFVNHLYITHMPSNLGVSTSWNLIIKSFVNSKYWIIVNDDVAFMPGILEEIYIRAQEENVGIINPYSGDFNLGAWDFFLIKDWVVQSHGLFDENLTPAYCEDADYIMRLIVSPIDRVVGLQTRYLHGDGYCDEYYEHGSQTRKSDIDLANKLESVNITNFSYMNEKWGEGWRNCSPFRTPFNKEVDIKMTTFNLDFVKSKHLGF